MNINDFLSIAIVGAFLSIAIQFIKNKFSMNTNMVKLMTILLAILVGGSYYFLSQTAWWQSILGVLAASSTVYALFLKGNSK